MMRSSSGQKIGRNDICWCGSGVKYKRCHLSADESPSGVADYDEHSRRQDAQRAKEFFTSSRTRLMCLCPPSMTKDCSTQIVRSHTVQRRRALSLIGENGKVLTMIPGNHAFFADNADPEEPHEIYIRNASTMPTFCARHDQEIFRPIEADEIEPTFQQAFLFHYRAECRELYAKLSHGEAIRFADTVGPKVAAPMFALRQMESSMNQLSVAVGLSDIRRSKTALDRMLVQQNYAVRFAWLLFAQQPQFVASGSAFPEIDFSGRPLQDLSDMRVPARSVSVTCIPCRAGTGILFAWTDADDDIASKLIESLLAIPDEYKADAAARYIFAHLENTYLRPSWWRSLDPQDRKTIRALMASGFELSRDARLLTPDPSRIIFPWRLQEWRVC